MIKRFLVIIFLHFSLGLVTAFAQDCAAKKIHYVRCSKPFDVGYKEFEKSMSFPVIKGRTQKIVLTLRGEKDYYFSVCSESGEKLNFKIRNSNNLDELIFENTGSGHAQFVEFSLLLTCKLLIEITLPANGKEKNESKECVGVLFYEKDH